MLTKNWESEFAYGCLQPFFTLSPKAIKRATILQIIKLIIIIFLKKCLDHAKTVGWPISKF